FISVISACERTPSELPVLTKARAKRLDCSRSRMNAPEPVFTSMAIASSPAAHFFEIIDATIRGIASIVAVASRSAYSFRSAGAISAACRVFIYLGFGNVLEVENLARVQHRQRQRRLFGVGHAVEENGHEPRRNLIFGNVAAGYAADEEFDFLAREFAAVALLANDVLRSQLSSVSARARLLPAR